MGSAPEAPSWDRIEGIFDACFGSNARDMLKSDSTADIVSVGWIDSNGRRFPVENLDDLSDAYAANRVSEFYFHGRVSGLYADFQCNPGAPYPRAVLAVEAEDEEAVVAALEVAAAVFPLPHEAGLIFLSWSGPSSLAVAKSLRMLLRSRFPMLEVFLSNTSIDPGDDPMRRILDEGLLRCQVLVAALTPQAVARPWVIWEIAAAWGRGQLVIPFFIGVSPKDIPGPLAQRVQGIHLDEGEALDRALEVIADRFVLPAPAPLTEDEREFLRLAAPTIA